MKHVLISGLLVILGLTAQAQKFKDNAYYISVDEENDLFQSRDKSDQNYTNGTKITYLSSGRLAKNKWWYNWFLFSTEKQTHHMNGFQLGQEMFTPGDLSVTVDTLMNRPYSGYTYLKFMRVSNSRSMGHRIISSNSVGLFGYDSKAECVQRFIHNGLGGGDDPKGWENGYLRTEVIVLDYQIQYEGRMISRLYNKIESPKGLQDSDAFMRNKPLHSHFDVISFVNTRLGQVKNEVGVGLLLKIGFFNNHFASTLPVFENDNRYRYRLDTNLRNNTHRGKVYANWHHNSLLGAFRPHQIFFFFKPAFTVVASNAHLQGGTWNSFRHWITGRGVENGNLIEPNQLNRYVPGLDVGVVLSFEAITCTFTSHYRYPEYIGATPHKWGSVSVSYLY